MKEISIKNEKYQELIKSIKSLESAAVAFSGGVDSTFLASAAHEARGGRLKKLKNWQHPLELGTM